MTLAVKEVIDNDYCFDEVLTVCEETSEFVDREICTYEYAREDVETDCTTTQVGLIKRSADCTTPKVIWITAYQLIVPPHR